jgi:hypothetical protein
MIYFASGAEVVPAPDDEPPFGITGLAFLRQQADIA